MKLKFICWSIFLIIILQGCSSQSDEDNYLADNGKLDLTEWNEEKTLIELNGQWDFYWNQLLNPIDFQTNTTTKQTGTIYLPSNWHTYNVNGNPLPKEGFATFRLRVSLPHTDSVLGLKLPIMYSNYNLWIDNQLVAKTGQVGTNKETSIAQKYPKVVYFSPDDSEFTMTLQISNFHNYAGGMWEPITIGDYEKIHNSHSRKIISQSILLGVLILSGIYHIGLGFFRKTESYFFYFGAFCLVAAFRYLMVGDVFLTKIFPNINWELAMKLEYISLYSHVPLVAIVLYSLYPKDSYKWFTLLSIYVAIFYDIITIVTEAKTYYSFLIYFQIFMIIGVSYVLFVIIKALRREREEGFYVLTGIVILMASILFDLFGFILKYPELNFYPIGIAIFVLCFSLLLSKRLSSSLDLSEDLTKDLSKLNSELETKVEQRTRQIMHSHLKLETLNDQLKKMALVDGLTNIPNRRQFDEYYKKQFEICWKEMILLSIIFIDIDYFKKYNDLYGHQQGDECLKLVAQSINKKVAELPEGIAARYGGEEFVCVIPNSDKVDLLNFTQELHQRIEQLKIPHENSSVSKYVTVSIGLFSIVPSETTTMDAILRQADHALYQAKLDGRNQISS
ncbi:sensor domain-containing diguanylate cyclase [Aquibacillus rhizosphaerae]|uniref:Diguanylate cyclase n=1 Tax=Aquibacillus rhizosphaerae TaxID=3051431 RepID=A0ABT7L3X4_9BACI|nr:diguanylate cyclase [Aquibacillus sp. LR5S19]MDL4840573.1 diguanylate cyclase [Aquibacillus sp. LR5S19]